MGLYGSFADLLEYPGPDVGRRLDACVASIDGSRLDEPRGEAAAMLRRFRERIGRVGLAGMEEAYTAAFDMDPGCTLSVGHHLFGETQHRSLFMSRLAVIYSEAGFVQTGSELPDHLPTMLRFVDGLGATDQARVTLVDDAIVPACRAIAEALGRRDDPYALAFRALLMALEGSAAAAAAGEEATR